MGERKNIDELRKEIREYVQNAKRLIELLKQNNIDIEIFDLINREGLFWVGYISCQETIGKKNENDVQ